MLRRQRMSFVRDVKTLLVYYSRSALIEYPNQIFDLVPAIMLPPNAD
jgi:hypothetical protein